VPTFARKYKQVGGGGDELGYNEESSLCMCKQYVWIIYSFYKLESKGVEL
jgi:hypothetical protein